MAKLAVDVNSLVVLEGKFPARALGMLIEWASQHQTELMKDWELARDGKPTRKIKPLNPDIS